MKEDIDFSEMTDEELRRQRDWFYRRGWDQNAERVEAELEDRGAFYGDSKTRR